MFLGVFQILAIVVGIEAIIGNALLILAVATGCQAMAPSFRNMQYFDCGIRMFYTIGFAFSAPV